MTLYELIQKYGSDKGLNAMWKTTEFITKYINKLSQEDQDCLFRDVYGYLSDYHYNEHFADLRVDKMYYVYDNIKHTGPFITKDKILAWYNSVQPQMKKYNMWDYYVTVLMIYSDNYALLKRWFPDITEEQIELKIYEMAINWLQDEDNPFGDHKIWCYFNSKEQ